MRVRHRFGYARQAVTWLFGDKARAAGLRVPIIVSEAVEGAFGNCCAAMLARLEGNRHVEVVAGRLSLPRQDNARALSFRGADVALVRVRRQETDRARG